MANRQSRLVGLEDFKGKGAVGAGLPGASGTTGAADFTAAAKQFEQLGVQLSGYADRATVIEATEKGTADALAAGDNLTTRRDGTLAGEAYDKAASDVILGKQEIAVQNAMFEAYQANERNPAKLKEAIDKIKAEHSASPAMADPEIRAAFEKRVERIRFSYEKQALVKQHDELRATAATVQHEAIDTATRGLERMAFGLGTDPAADQPVAEEMAKVRRMIANGRAAGYITPAAALRLDKNVEQTASLARIEGAFGRLETTEQRQQFIAGIEKDWEDGTGAIAAFDLDHYQRVRNRLATRINRDVAADNQQRRAIDTNLTQIAQRAVNGEGVSDEEWSGIEQVAMRMGGDAQQRVQQGRRDAAQIDSWWSMKPDELEAAIRAERLKLSQPNEDNPERRVRLDQAVRVHDAMRKEMKDDLLGFSERRQRITPTALDPQTVMLPLQEAGVKFAERKAAAEQAAEFAGVAPQYFSKLERRQWVEFLNKGGPDAEAAVLTMTRHWGPQTTLSAIGEFSEEAGAMAHAAGVVASGGSRDFMRNVSRAMQYAQMPGYKNLDLKNADVRTQAAAVYGEAFSAAPATEARAMEASRIAFDAMARDQRLTADIRTNGKSRDGFRRTLQEAAGAVFDNGVQYGGVAVVNGRRTLVPPSIKAERMVDVVGLIRDEDIAEPPIGGTNGRAIPVSELRTAKMVAIGDGRYRVARGDPDGDRPQWFMDARTGEPWIFDIKALEPTLRTRRPDLFRGGG